MRVVGTARRAGGPCTNGVTESAHLVFSRAWPVEQAVTGRGMRLWPHKSGFWALVPYPAELARRGAMPPPGGMVAHGILGGGH